MAAKNSLTAQTLTQELAHARKGLAFYQKEAARLAKKIEKLGINPSGRGRRDPSLPVTTSDFWVTLMGKRPKTHQQVMDAAVKALKMNEPAAEALLKLRNRWNVALIGLVKSGRIVAEGAGRERKFSSPA